MTILIVGEYLKLYTSKMLNLKYSFFESRTTPDLIFRMKAIGISGNFITNIIVGVGDIFVILFGVVYFASISYKLLLFELVLYFIAYFLLNYIYNVMVEKSSELLPQITKIEMSKSEMIKSMFSIKMLHLEDVFLKKTIDAFDKVSKGNSITRFYKKIYFLLPAYIYFIYTVSILGFLKIMLPQITTGTIISISFISLFCLFNFISVVRINIEEGEMLKQISRTDEIIHEEVKHCVKHRIGDFKTLELKNVSFSYNSRSNILDDISFKLCKGEKIAIVGESGSGKSTLFKIISDIYTPTQGGVYINGEAYNNFKFTRYKTIMGGVPQHPQLFEGSIKSNVLIGMEHTSIEKFQSILQMVGLLDDISAMPMKEETLISENCSNISDGQRFRLALARTLIMEPEVVIFDEPYCMKELTLNEELCSFFNDRTQIIFTSKYDIASLADYIYILKNGRIVESGKFNELVRQKDSFFMEVVH